MFTWNFQYVSKKRLADTLGQLMIDSRKGNEILIRIHTAVHNAEEAVDLAAFIKDIIPGAQILGTSTSAVISGGKLIHDQCIISITQMSEGSVQVARVPLQDGPDDAAMSAEALCHWVGEALVRKNTKLLLAFLPAEYQDVERFTGISYEKLPGVQMIGGGVDWNDIVGDAGFVFDESGWSSQDAIFAALSGDVMESRANFVTGVQVVGETHEVTKVLGNRILEIDGKPAAEFMHEGIGEKVSKMPDVGFYFPLTYSENGLDVPFAISYSGKDGLVANHNVTLGRKIRRAFFYDRQIVSDNRSMFNQVESFAKGETIFAYACSYRYVIYPNSVKWELSAYENSNTCGCLIRGEIGAVRGRNIYTNCAFVLAVAGEYPDSQQYNPYVFNHTESLAEDNQKLIGCLMDAARLRAEESDASMTRSLQSFIQSCEQKILYSEKQGIANEAALNMDIQLNGYDRVCLIDVLDTASMRMVFPEQLIDKTHEHYVTECSTFAARKNYRLYTLDRWQVAIAVPSYMVSLADFVEDMKILQKKLFEATEEYVAIVSVFCVINECTVENIRSEYNAALLEMMQKNIQFYICDGREDQLDEESIREKYRMVNVINYALSNDRVIPYYQGIHDNKTNTIHHYEALMRLEDENGRVYTPYTFLDIARSFGLLYDALSMAMLKKVFEKFRNSPDKSVSINLGLRDIKNEELTAYIYSFLSTARYPGNFVFEILENEDVDEYDTLLRFVNSIHKLGGQISIDDFGNGYSNLMHVINIPSDYLKIDGSIVRECCNNKESENLVALISSWNRMNAHGSKIVAEFVENEAIQEKLIHYDIDYSQGYLFSKPSPEVPGL